jgi:hypothetical protein
MQTMNKFKFTTAVFASLTLTGFSQNANTDYSTALKISNMTSFERHSTSRGWNDSLSEHLHYTNKGLRVLQPTIGFQWKGEKDNFHEVELTNFSVGRTSSASEMINDSTGLVRIVGGNKISNTSIAIRYEYIALFNKSSDSRLVPSLGLAVSPYFVSEKISPLTSEYFETMESRTGVRGFASPRITYFTASRVFFDLNIPICFVDFSVLTTRQENPVIPPKQRSITTFDFQQFPSFYSLRFGVGIKL